MTPEVKEKFTRKLRSVPVAFSGLYRNNCIFKLGIILRVILHNLAAWLYNSRRKLATCGVGLLACLMAWHVVFGANGLMVYQQKRREHRQLQQQIQAVQQQNENLEREIKALKNDPQTIEKEARERLRYARPGEVVYTLPTKPATIPVGKK